MYCTLNPLRVYKQCFTASVPWQVNYYFYCFALDYLKIVDSYDILHRVFFNSENAFDIISLCCRHVRMLISFVLLADSPIMYVGKVGIMYLFYRILPFDLNNTIGILQKYLIKTI